jgi:hypothetical protein
MEMPKKGSPQKSTKIQQIKKMTDWIKKQVADADQTLTPGPLGGEETGASTSMCARQQLWQTGRPRFGTLTAHLPTPNSSA